MRTLSALWTAYQAEVNPTWSYEYKCVVDGQIYEGNEILTFEKVGGFSSNDFSLGNCPSIEFDITVIAKSSIIVAKNAKIEPYTRINGNDGVTDWVRIGVYFIDTREKLTGGKLKLSCLDRMMFAEQTFLVDGEDLDDYPMAIDTAMARIYTATGLVLDARDTISHTKCIEYPNDMTMREVMEYVASAHGANFVVTDEDYLHLVTPGYSTSLFAVTISNAKGIVKGNTPITFDSVAMIYSEDGSYFETGTGENELEITNSWSTQVMCDEIQALLNGFTWSPYEVISVRLDPALEYGDHITINGVDSLLWYYGMNSRLYYDVTIPSSTDSNQSEFKYVGTLSKSLSKKVTLGGSYYGTSISREKGIYQARSDGLSEFLLNSDVFAMRALVDEVMTDKIYFDPVTGTYIFDGTLSANVITALSAVITPNLYADKATISELTVDQLDTSVKIQNYLNEDKSDVNYIKIVGQSIQFINAKASSNYSSERTSSDQWDMVSNTQVDMYYSSINIDEDTGSITFSNGLEMNAWDAFNAGRIYRALDTETYYKLTGNSSLAFVYYDIYAILVITTDYEQAQNRNGNLLYWIDETHTSATTDITAYPVYNYLYNELVKMEHSFCYDSSEDELLPEILLGVGTGVTSQSGKGRVKKSIDGLEMTYISSDGDDTAGVYWCDDGFVDVTARRSNVVINTTNQNITITPEGDGQSDIVIDYTESGDVLTLTWPDNEIFTVEVTT